MVLALATTMWVVDRVHDRTTDRRTNALPAAAASFTNGDVGMIGIADLTNGCTAGELNTTELGGRHTQNCVTIVLTHQLNRCTSGAGDCGTATRLELNSVNKRTNRNVGKRQAVARLDVCIGAGLNNIADLQALRSQNVGLGTIYIVKQSDACRAVRIVLDGCNLCRYTILTTLEVDHTIHALVTAALVASCYATVVITASLLGQRLEKRLLGLSRRNLREV